jgi:hypothetical protein
MHFDVKFGEFQHFCFRPIQEKPRVHFTESVIQQTSGEQNIAIQIQRRPTSGLDIVKDEEVLDLSDESDEEAVTIQSLAISSVDVRTKPNLTKEESKLISKLSEPIALDTLQRSIENGNI